MRQMRASDMMAYTRYFKVLFKKALCFNGLVVHYKEEKMDMYEIHK